MKIVFFDDWRLGVLKRDQVIDVFRIVQDIPHTGPRCLEWATSIHALEPGDILATGTNHRGLSAFQDGALVEMETEGLGRLHVRVRDALERTWARETRLERQQKGLEGTTPQLSGKHAPTASRA